MGIRYIPQPFKESLGPVDVSIMNHADLTKVRFKRSSNHEDPSSDSNPMPHGSMLFNSLSQVSVSSSVNSKVTLVAMVKGDTIC